MTRWSATMHAMIGGAASSMAAAKRKVCRHKACLNFLSKVRTNLREIFVNLRLWLYVLWNWFYRRKRSFLSIISNYKNPQLFLFACCCSVNNGWIAVSQRRKGHEKSIFETPHNKIKCIWASKNQISMEKKGPNFYICLRSGPRGLTTPSPPYSQPYRKISVLLTTSFNDILKFLMYRVLFFMFRPKNNYKV